MKLVNQLHGGMALAALSLVACLGSGCSSGSGTPPPLGVSVSASVASVQTAGTATITAIVSNDRNGAGVTWTVSCAVTACGSVSTAAGLTTTFTALSTPPANDLNVTITATSVADPTKSGSATVTVKAISVSVSPATSTVQVSGSADFSSSVNYDPGTASVNWNVTCSATSCGTVTSNGTTATYTAPNSAPASNLTVTLTATSITDTTKSASATITVPSIAVAVTPAMANVLFGDSSKFTATLVGDSANRGVSWAVSCPISSCGSLAATSTANGIANTYTAPSASPASDVTVTLTATSVANSMAVASATVTVPAITVDTEPTSATLTATTTQQFTATVGNDPNSKGVTWTVTCSASDCGSLSITSTTSGGATTYTAPTTPPANDLTVTVTAASVTDATKIGSATVTVPAITVSAISPPNGIIPINATQDFTATINNDPTNLGVNWTLIQNGTNCSPACGTVSPAKTASGTAATFTAPATVPASTAVTINAASAADATKSSNATVTLTNGIVKLIPASLAFSCKMNGTTVNKCPPRAQAIILTNSGSTTLNLNNVTIGGTDAAQFTETNDCASTVAASASCSISVTFKPTAARSYSASVSFDDSSADSPQQVALSGKANLGGRINQQAALADLASAASASVPAPSGPDLVGTREIHITDQSREDPYVSNGTKRELAVRLWYPASLRPNQDCTPAPYTSPTVWNYFGQLVGVRPFPVKTNSCLNAPVASDAHPIVVFTPGLTATFTDYTYLMEDLASRGYVVAAVAHTYEATAVELSDGRLAKSVVGSHLGGSFPADGKSLSTAVYARLLDLKFVVSEIERMNARDSVFAGKLDLSKIAIAGHSLGGLTALTASEFDPRFNAVILMDGFVPAALPSATRKPVLILGAGRENWEPTECQLWNNLKGPRLALNLRDTEHAALGDWIWLTQGSVKTGQMGPEKTMMAIRDYIAAFLDVSLRGKTLDPAREALLNGSSSEYPDATVTTQEQPLCRNR